MSKTSNTRSIIVEISLNLESLHLIFRATHLLHSLPILELSLISLKSKLNFFRNFQQISKTHL